ncbi:MAG: electron transfer flavoprotein subunit beta/FixA family protein [Chloroflexota bacterium]|nr:electron transfer flavoprotein subunit beta/FixA family protein [Chloroflexota bacterium]
MDIIVCMKQVPDLVEELELNDDSTGLNRDFLKLVVNEFDDWALEQALLLKEQHGGTVTCLALDTPDVDNTLFTAYAKGADKAIKITGDFAGGATSHHAAKLFAQAIKTIPHDLILTGVQSAEDLDGQTGVLLATYLGIPHVSVVTGVEANGTLRVATVRKEYAGGMLAEFEVDLPAVLGIQAAKQAPRYAPISKVRALTKEKKIDTLSLSDGAADAGITIRRMFKPESGRHAEMIDGDVDAVVERVVGILKEKAILK